MSTEQMAKRKAQSAKRSEQWLKAPPEADQPQAEVGSKQRREC